MARANSARSADVLAVIGASDMHNPDCPICRVAIARAPYRTKDRRGVVVEHPEPKDKGDGLPR